MSYNDKDAAVNGAGKSAEEILKEMGM